MNFIPKPFKTGFDITNKKKRICTFMMKRPFDITTIFHIRLNLKKGVGGDFMFGEGFYPTCSTMPYILNCTSDWVKVKLKYIYEESKLF
ncbi:hypothetical protein [Bacillus subtilis]|uniref:hypothetical protein n=1 Tax=Bacillus subtilis TaxID=1423 RepID=UPI00202A4F2E|nr:hypothetical protein [Bacillus subtilis]